TAPAVIGPLPAQTGTASDQDGRDREEYAHVPTAGPAPVAQSPGGTPQAQTLGGEFGAGTAAGQEGHSTPGASESYSPTRSAYTEPGREADESATEYARTAPTAAPTLFGVLAAPAPVVLHSVDDPPAPAARPSANPGPRVEPAAGPTTAAEAPG